MRFLEAVELFALADAVRPSHYRPLVLTAGFQGLRWASSPAFRSRTSTSCASRCGSTVSLST